MAGSLNRVSLIGHLGADPEARRTTSGALVVNLRIATSDTWTDKQSGEKKEATEWHTIVIFGATPDQPGLAGIAEKYLRKGHKVFVEGKLRTRKWQDQSGADRWTTEVHLSSFNAQLILLEKAERPPPADAPVDEGRGAPMNPDQVAQRRREEMDDEIPF
jgi:single-strand DNA-binding protein